LKRLIVADSVRTPAGIAGNALLIEDGTILEVGEAAQLQSHDLRITRFPDAVIIPGLRDAHLHPLALASGGMLLSNMTTIRDLQQRLPDAPGVTMGSGLDERTLAEGRLPTRDDLDVVDRPVVLFRICGHVAIANTAALVAAGIGPDVLDPPGGSFDRNSDGTPNGILRETAIAAVTSRLEMPSVTRVQLLSALTRLTRLGITSIGAVVTSSWSEPIDPIIEAADDLPLRVHAILEEPVGIGRLTSQRLRFAGLKAFADGSLGARTAALTRPYDDDPGNSGILRLNLSPAKARFALDRDGLVAVHAIGDLAVERVLDLFEALIGEGADPGRLRIEHASILPDISLRRMAKLGVTACVQPAFVPTDAPWLPSRLGEDRAARAYRFASMVDGGVPLCGGSDAPVESPDPFLGMAAARDRNGFHTEEALTAQQAFELFTSGGARSLGEPPPLEPGSPADFVVVDRDPVLSSPALVRATNVMSTWVGGSEVGSYS
jgi:predicted amidohydrolase YtcJ